MKLKSAVLWSSAVHTDTRYVALILCFFLAWVVAHGPNWLSRSAEFVPYLYDPYVHLLHPIATAASKAASAR